MPRAGQRSLSVRRSSTSDVPLADFGRLFGPNGVFEVLQDRARGARRHDSLAVDPGGPARRSVGVGDMLRAVRGGAAHPSDVLPVVESRRCGSRSLPTDSTAESTRFLLEIDGQEARNRHDPSASRADGRGPARSPGSRRRRSSRPAGRTSRSKAHGRWFRLLDSGQADRESDSRYLLTFKQDAPQVQVPSRPPASAIRSARRPAAVPLRMRAGITRGDRSWLLRQAAQSR